MKTVDIPQEIDAVNRLFEQFASKADFSNLEGVYTKDARVLPPGADAITGLQAIQDFWQAAAGSMGLKTLTLKTLEFDLFEDHAFEIGQGDIVTTHAAPSTMSVKYVVVWKKQGGAWRWDVDIWNPKAA